MATNKKVNQVFVNGIEIMSTREDTVSENNLLQGETATNHEGEKITGNLDPAGKDEAYMTSDEISNDLADEDYLPFYDVSEQQKKNTLFSRIVEKLKNVFLMKSSSNVADININGNVLSLKENDIDASKTDNNVSDIKYPSTANILDKEGRTITRYEAVVNPNGNIGAKIYVNNYDTSGTLVGQKGIQFHMNKSGNLTYNVDDYNAFRSAIQTVDQQGTAIPNNTDLDTYKTAGTYRVSSDASAQTITHLPLALCGKVLVFDNGNGGFTQFYIPNHDPKMYMRNFWSNAWSNWLDLTQGGGDSKTHTYEVGTRIPASSDFNNYSTEGVYYVASNADAETMTNFPPTTSAGKLLVMKTINSTNYFTQLYVAINNKYYSRRYDNNNPVVWTDWVEIANLDDVVTWEQNNLIGSKNLLPIIYRGQTFTRNDLTFSFDDDGVLTVNGTANANTEVNFYPNTNGFYSMASGNRSHLFLKKGTYIYSGGESGDSDLGAYLILNNINGEALWRRADPSYQFTVTDASYPISVGLYVVNGTTLSNKKYYPMIRYASIKDDTFEPYGKTNQQISDEITDKIITNLCAPIPANSDLNTYVREGVYYCEFSTTARTMSNLPYTGDDRQAFKLIVMKARNNSNFIQWYIPYDTSSKKISYRTTDDLGANWTSWYHVANTTDITPAQVGNGYANATISGSAITATISGFQLRAGVIVAIYMPDTITSACTLNISNTGAKAVKIWTSLDPSSGYPLLEGVNTFVYNGTSYIKIAQEKSMLLFKNNYVADTSGDIGTQWGYGVNKAQLKFNIATNKLLWNYYKNSTWRGDVTLADYDDIVHQTLGINIPDNSNLNDYTTNGIYKIGSNASALTITNCPCGRAGKLIVEHIVGSNYVVQTYHTYHQDVSSLDGVYRRAYASGWTAWYCNAVIYTDSSDNKKLVLYHETTTANDKYVGIRFQIKDTTTNQSYSRDAIIAYQDHQATPYGLNMVIDSGGALFLGGGEAGQAHYNALTKPVTNENLYLTADGDIFIQTNAGTIANRIGFRINSSGQMYPCRADIGTDNICSIGTSSYKLANVFTNKINDRAVGDLGCLLTKYHDMPDNSGYPKYLKMCDVTTWYNSTTTGQMTQSFVGWIISSREGGYFSQNNIVEINAGVTYAKSTSVNQDSLHLYTSDGNYLPVILKETLDGVTKYYLAIKITSSGRVIILSGRFRMNDSSASNYIGTWVNCTDSSGTLPTGYSVQISGKVMQRKTAYATCTTASDQQIKVATIDDPTWVRQVGCIVGVRFTNTNTYSSTTSAPCQLNVNNTGAKNIYYNNTHSGAGNTGTSSMLYGLANRTNFYMYDGTYWVWISAGYEQTYSPASLGFGYGTCDTAESTTAKVVTMSNYSLTTGGYVTVYFTNAVPANATMNINSRGAIPIYFRGSAIKAGIIKGDTRATFVYNGTNYSLVSVDRTPNIFVNYRYSDSAGTPSTTHISNKVSELAVTEVSYVTQGDTVNLGLCLRWASAKTYSSGTALFKVSYQPLQVIYWGDCLGKIQGYMDSSGNFYIRTNTAVGANTNYYVQLSYIKKN